jgi:hypothetical protein
MKDHLKACIFFTCFFIAGCDQHPSQTERIKTAGIPPVSSRISMAEPGDLGDFNHLSPVKILNPKSSNVYEKYGIEFEGNCYNCDLASIRINKKNFDLVNVCDKADYYRNEDFSYAVRSNGLTIKTGKNEFIFTRIDKAPVYELKILGDPISLKKKRISKFYTPAKELKKFKQHDCGEFDG